MRRFRRKPKVLWLPTLATDASAEAGSEGGPSIGRAFSISVGADGLIEWDAQPVTFDYSDSASAEQYLFSQRADLHTISAGNVYRLRRIVGKCFAASFGNIDALGDTALVDFAAGFIVCRTDDDGNAITDFTATNPLAQDSADDPWIWRRRWLLNPYQGQYVWTQPITAGVGSGAQLGFPNSNVQYGSVQDGPHIDQKTARIISRQERLYFVTAARAISLGGITVQPPAGTAGVSVVGYLDVRLLASLRMNSGNRRNASR